jgi:hypothetical protein
MSDAPGVIRFSASVAYVKTMADGSPRVVLDMPEAGLEALFMLAQCKLRGVVLEFAAVPLDKIVTPEKQRENSNAAIPARSEWQS